MRKPTPVTTRIITEESGSSWKATGGARAPPPGAPPPPPAPPRPRLRQQKRALGEERDRAVHDHPQKRKRGHQPEVVEDPAYHLSMLSSVMSTVSLSR